MKNFTLLLILVSGLLAGYMIGDYRGKDARESLQKAIETGKNLDTERAATLAKLKTELDDINDLHRRKLEAIRKDNESRMAAWRRTKSGLDDKIKHSTAKLAEFDNRLKTLAALRDAASGAETDQLNLQIERLRKEREDLRRKIEGNACLQTRVPQSVFDALNETNPVEGK
jgi:DNA repair exonuclease SbcCD ATPase subunit